MSYSLRSQYAVCLEDESDEDGRKQCPFENNNQSPRFRNTLGDRSERIRTYNFPQNRLTDHRINLTLYSLDRVMEGLMDDLLDALVSRNEDLRLESQLSRIAGGTANA